MEKDVLRMLADDGKPLAITVEDLGETRQVTRYGGGVETGLTPEQIRNPWGATPGRSSSTARGWRPNPGTPRSGPG